jgi:hypothetical protein
MAATSTTTAECCQWLTPEKTPEVRNFLFATTVKTPNTSTDIIPALEK